MAGIDILSDEEDEVLCPKEPSGNTKQKDDELVALWSESEEEMLTAPKTNPTPSEAVKAAPKEEALAPVAELSDDEDEMLCPAKVPSDPRPPATPQGEKAEATAEKSSEKPKKAKAKAKPQAKAAEKPPAPAAPDPATMPAPPAEKESVKPDPQPKVGAKAKGGDVKGDKKEVKKLSKDEMEAKVLEYMRQQNRPYNSQNVFDNLHGAVPKASVQAIMDSLAAEGKLRLKEYGKIKVFLVSQTSVAGSSEAGTLQHEVDEVSKKRKELHGSLETLRKEMSQVSAKHSAVKEAQESKAEASKLQEQAEKWRHATADGDRVDESEVLAVEAQFAQVHQAWRKRKRLCMETLSTLGEGMGLRTSNMVEKYGVDTDEDCNQLMPQEFMQ